MLTSLISALSILITRWGQRYKLIQNKLFLTPISFCLSEEIRGFPFEATDSVTEKGGGDFLQIFQGQKPFGSKDGLSRHKQFFGRYFVKLFEEFLLGEGKAIVKVTLCHADGYVLEVVV